MLCGGIHLYAKTSRKSYFKRFSGVEKAHRNSIKITVDFWRSGRDSNPRAAQHGHTISNRAPSANSDNSPRDCIIITEEDSKIKSFFIFF